MGGRRTSGRLRRAIGFAALTACSLGCAEKVAPVPFGGFDPHILIHGVNEGVPTDGDVTDPMALQMAFFHCERTYRVPVINGMQDPSMATLTATTVSFFFLSADGRPRTFQITIAQHDFSQDVLGTSFAITPRREGVSIDPDQVIFEMSITDFLLDEEYLHAAAKLGTVTLYDFSGTPPPGSNIIPAGDGSVGLTYDAVFHPEGYFRGSFEAPCTANRIETYVP